MICKKGSKAAWIISQWTPWIYFYPPTLQLPEGDLEDHSTDPPENEGRCMKPKMQLDASSMGVRSRDCFKIALKPESWKWCMKVSCYARVDGTIVEIPLPYVFPYPPINRSPRFNRKGQDRRLCPRKCWSVSRLAFPKTQNSTRLQKLIGIQDIFKDTNNLNPNPTSSSLSTKLRRSRLKNHFFDRAEIFLKKNVHPTEQRAGKRPTRFRCHNWS